MENSGNGQANIAHRLTLTAAADPGGVGVVEPRGRRKDGSREYAQLSFAELERDSGVLAEGLRALGVKPGMRIVLMVRPGIDFISLVFALFKTGAVVVLIDPGMGRSNLVKCLTDVEPEGFVAIPLAHAVRSVLRFKFPKAKIAVTAGRRWFWGGVTLASLRRQPLEPMPAAPAAASDPAAIIFTTGSTGPPKGVLYRHGNFNAQVDQIRDYYNIQPGETDIPGFPLFGLFNAAMGVTTVVPDMDPTRPAAVNPLNIIEAAQDWSATQAFGSPALWRVVGDYCEEHQFKLPTLIRVLTAGAPAPPDVLQKIQNAIHAEGEMHTPYGATESLPVASISSRMVLSETAEKTRQGEGTCVGPRFPGIRWKVIRPVEGPIATIEDVEELPYGHIGEIIVSGPQVTTEYVTRTEANALHKIEDGDTFWHRIGDVGYFDSSDRFWFCGRKAHVVHTVDGPMYPVRCEAIINNHPRVYRSALVGVGARGVQRAVMIVEPLEDEFPASTATEQFTAELAEIAAGNDLTRPISRFLFHRSLPVDIRHNAKIFREKLAVWAAKQTGADA